VKGARRKEFIQVTAAVIVDQGQVLITQRHAHDHMADKWEFPGGKIEPGETPEACLQRELQEELGLLVDVQELYLVTQHRYPHINIKLLAFRVHIRSGQITLRAHQDYQWVPIQELATFDFSDADKPIVHKLIQDDLI
jgi:8-oxo-dGTP diphosphatase